MIDDESRSISRLDVIARVDALKYEYSYPGTDLSAFESVLRARARTRKLATAVTTGFILIATLTFRRRDLNRMDAIFYGIIALMFGLGSDRCRREIAAADELLWLRQRLD